MAIDPVTRREWGAREPRGSYSRLSSTKGVKVHYTGGQVSPDIVNDHAKCVALVKSIQNQHMDSNGWMDIGYCVDERTEILTRDGWKSYKDLDVGDIVLTLNHETAMSEWQPVLEVCVFPAMEREMVQMEGTCHSSLTTPHHRWPVERYRRRTGTERKKGPDGRWLPVGKAQRSVTSYERLWVTSETLGYWDRIPIAAPCADLPIEAKWSDAFVEVLAWFWTEGHIKRIRGVRSTSVVIYQAQKNSANVASIRSALSELFGPSVDGFPRVGRVTDGVPRWREVINRNLVEFHLSSDAGIHLLEMAPDRVPSFDFLLTLTKTQLSLFVEISMLADNAGTDRLAQKAGLPQRRSCLRSCCQVRPHRSGVGLRPGAARQRCGWSLSGNKRTLLHEVPPPGKMRRSRFNGRNTTVKFGARVRRIRVGSRVVMVLSTSRETL
ncbi:hypothetical protein ACFQX6_00960 [Streptosporangium lutulentum]